MRIVLSLLCAIGTLVGCASKPEAMGILISNVLICPDGILATGEESLPVREKRAIYHIATSKKAGEVISGKQVAETDEFVVRTKPGAPLTVEVGGERCIGSDSGSAITIVVKPQE